ncbi:hypothetical protein WN943_008279 [Citrus x changshan-huyou]
MNYFGKELTLWPSAWDHNSIYRTSYFPSSTIAKLVLMATCYYLHNELRIRKVPKLGLDSLEICSQPPKNKDEYQVRNNQDQ